MDSILTANSADEKEFHDKKQQYELEFLQVRRVVPIWDTVIWEPFPLLRSKPKAQ